MKITYQKPVLDLEATGIKIKTIMKQRGVFASGENNHHASIRKHQ